MKTIQLKIIHESNSKQDNRNLLNICLKSNYLREILYYFMADNAGVDYYTISNWGNFININKQRYKGENKITQYPFVCKCKKTHSIWCWNEKN